MEHKTCIVVGGKSRRRLACHLTTAAVLVALAPAGEEIGDWGLLDSTRLDDIRPGTSTALPCARCQPVQLLSKLPAISAHTNHSRLRFIAGSCSPGYSLNDAYGPRHMCAHWPATSHSDAFLETSSISKTGLVASSRGWDVVAVWHVHSDRLYPLWPCRSYLRRWCLATPQIHAKARIHAFAVDYRRLNRHDIHPTATVVGTLA